MGDRESLLNGRVNTLSFCTKQAYAVGHVLNDLCASMWFTYLLLYLHLVLKFDNKLSGIILLVGQVADAVSTPFVGIESDRTDGFWMCRYGRRKTWHLIGTICVVLSFPFLFTRCIGCETSSEYVQAIYYCAFVVIFQFGWAAVQVSHLSLIPDLTSDQNQKTELNALRYAFTVISNIAVYAITWAVLGIANSGADANESSKIGPEDDVEFRNIVLIVVAVGIIQSIIFHIGVKEPNTHSWRTKRDVQYGAVERLEETEPLVQSLQWRDWFTNSTFYVVAALYMCTRLYVNLSQVYIPLYLQETLKLPQETVAIIPLVMFVSGFVSSFAMKPFNKCVGRKLVYVTGAAFAIAACVWVYFGNGESYRGAQLYAVAVCFGVGGSIVLITSLSITADLIGSNTKSCAFVYGAMSFTDKLANGVAILVVQSLHPPDHGCAGCDNYYKDVLSWGCGGAAVVALLSLAFLSTRHLDNSISGTSGSQNEDRGNGSSIEERI